MSFEYCLVVQMPKHWSFEDTKKRLDRLCSVLATPTVESVSTTLREFWVLLYINDLGGGERLYTPALVSQVLRMPWSWSLHQGSSLKKKFDWWRHQPCHMTRVYFTNQKLFLLTSEKNGWWRHNSTSLVKVILHDKFQLNCMSRTCETGWSLFSCWNSSL